MHLASLVFGYPADRLLRQVNRIMSDLVRLVRRDEIGQVDLTVLHHFLCIYLGVEITHVIHLLPELLHADRGQLLVVYHGRFAHLVRVAGKAFVRFGRRVRRSRVIDMQLQFPETEDLRVLLLPEITAQVAAGDRLVIHAFDLRLIQQVLPLRHELRRVAGTEHQKERKYYVDSISQVF